MIEIISDQNVRARKHHKCFHCYRSIVPGTIHRKSTLKYDGVYSLRFHPDCDALWYEYETNLCPSDYYDGYPPLIDEWINSGEFESLCDSYRGDFPHAVTRMEWWYSD